MKRWRRVCAMFLSIDPPPLSAVFTEYAVSNYVYTYVSSQPGFSRIRTTARLLTYTV